MRLIKNTATNAAELYKLLGNGNTVYSKRLGPVQINKLSLLTNPACDYVTVYTQDGSDYDEYIDELKAIVEFNLN